MNSPVFLVQTDTTIGFLSKNSANIDIKKRRLPEKEYLQTVSSFKNLKNYARIPNKFKKFVRNSNKTTFIYPNNKSIRVIQNNEHKEFLEYFGDFYSSSANISGEKFNDEVARNLADIICEDSRGFFESQPSKIYKIGRENIRKIR